MARTARLLRPETAMGHYGRLLALLFVTFVFAAAAPEGAVTRLVTVILQAGILLAALVAADAGTTEIAAAAVLLVLTSIAAVIAFQVGDQNFDGVLLGLGSLLVALAGLVIAIGVVRGIRREEAIHLEAVFGVLCVYLVIGMLFALIYGAISKLGTTPLYANGAHASPQANLYFSVTTLTTVGYGDLAPNGALARAVAMTEGLIGQVYLVTIVALIVGNLSRGSGPARDSGGTD
jgi:hypothetical protein